MTTPAGVTLRSGGVAMFPVMVMVSLMIDPFPRGPSPLSGRRRAPPTPELHPA